MHLNIDNIEHNMSNIALGVYKFIIKEQHLHSKQTALLTTLGNVKGAVHILCSTNLGSRETLLLCGWAKSNMIF